MPAIRRKNGCMIRAEFLQEAVHNPQIAPVALGVNLTTLYRGTDNTAWFLAMQAVLEPAGTQQRPHLRKMASEIDQSHSPGLNRP